MKTAISLALGLALVHQACASSVTVTAPMNHRRTSYATTQLQDGKVLTAGGWDGTNVLAYAELYNPATATWTDTGAMTIPLQNAAMVTMQDGRVMATSGGGTEIYDPATGTWAATASLTTTRLGFALVPLNNGKVLAIGGSDMNSPVWLPWPGASATAELYDPTTGTWSVTGSMTYGRMYFTATLLQNGKVLVAGGYGRLDAVDPFGDTTAELYDPRSGTWSVAAPLHFGRSGHNALLLTNGKVLVAGTEPQVEEYEPQTDTWTTIGTLPGAGVPPAVMVASGSVWMPWRDAYGDSSNPGLLNPSTGVWTPDIDVGHVTSATLLPTSKILLEYSDGAASLLDPATGNAAIVSLGNLEQVYDGSAKAVSTATIPPALPVTVTYDGSANPPTEVGSYTVIATINDAFFQGSATNTLLVTKIPTPITLGNLSQKYDGNPKSVSVTTDPPGLPVVVTYNGSTNPPTDIADYTVVATVDDPHYAGSVTNTLSIWCLLLDPPTSPVLTTGYKASWRVAGPMNKARQGHTATLLSDGRVLLAGGDASAEIYNPVTGVWSNTASMHAVRSGHTATVLQDGRVLVCGGNDSSGALQTTELFDPVNETWTLTGSMAFFRGGHSATLLPNGKVFVVGGSPGECELYDPATGIWQTVAALPYGRVGHTTTLLPNGKVLVCGGFNSFPGILNDVALYDSATDSWAAKAPLSVAMFQHSATLLADGRVMVIGGRAFSGSVGFTATEYYDPANDQWTPGASLLFGRLGHTATLLNDGRILVVGVPMFGAHPTTSAEIYHPDIGMWESAGSNPVGGYSQGITSASATLLPDGTVLIAGGGYIPVADAQVFDSCPYNIPWKASGGTPPYAISLTAGAVPSGMAFANAALTGRPAMTGPYSFSITATDGGGCLKTQTYSGTVAPPNISFDTSYPDGVTGQPYSENVNAIGGTPPYSYAVSGSFPTGLTLLTNGTIVGTPLIFRGPWHPQTFNFTLAVTDASGFGATNNVSISVNSTGDVQDTSSPSLVVTSPANNATLNSTTFVVKGTASDAPGAHRSGVAGVLCWWSKDPDRPFVFPPVLATTTNNFANWSATMSVPPGKTYLTVRSVDFSGNASTPVNITVTPKSLQPLTVLTSGPGTTSLKTGVKLQVGNAYRITATPKPGNILLRWDNSTGDSELPYRPTQGNYEYYFVMQSNLVLTATFVTNPIVAANAKGPYNGLFYETNASGAPAIAEQSAGAILNLNVQPNSSYSATIVCAGGKYTFKGAFIGPVASSYDYKVISRANIFKGPLRVLLNPDWTNHKITGQVNCGEEGWVSPLLLEASAYSVNHALSSVTQYTMAIAPAADAPVNSPGGYGYGTLKVTAQGLLQLNGALADGASPLTEAVQVASDGNWPLYCDLYNHTGLIAGWISLSGGAPSGQLTWIKPPGIGLYPNGFSNVVSAFGSLYTPRSPAINLAPGTLDVTDGSGLNLPQTFNVALSGNNTLANANGTSNSVTGTITTSSGLITVNFRPTGVGAITKTAKGVVLQSSNAACGAFIGNNDGTGKTNTGAIYLH